MRPFMILCCRADDKVLIILNYKGGLICATFDEISEAINIKANSDDNKNHQSSPELVVGDP